jgi:hypothetical protein
MTRFGSILTIISCRFTNNPLTEWEAPVFLEVTFVPGILRSMSSAILRRAELISRSDKSLSSTGR